MRNIKKSLYIPILIIIFAFILTGCANCISTETSTIQVKVINKYYESEYSVSRYDDILTRREQEIPHLYRWWDELR